MLRIAVLATLVVSMGCHDRAQDSTADPGQSGEVRIFGSFRGLFHEGMTGSQVSLADLLPDSGLYAVGALANLDGEATVLGGRAYLAVPEGDAVRTTASVSPRAGAALLIAARVSAWREVKLNRAVSWEDLDGEIEQLALSIGIDSDDRIPFLIEGDFEELHWHVVDGTRLPPGASSCEDHRAAAWRESRQQTRAVLVGFYSNSDEGVFTQMGSRTHVHCVVEGPLASGHVDRARLARGAIVKFPAHQAGRR